VNRTRLIAFRILLPAASGVLCALLAGGPDEEPSVKNNQPAMARMADAAPAPAPALVKPPRYATIDLWVDALATHERVEDLLVLSRQLPPGEDRNQVFRKLAYQWLPLDRKATMAWIESVPDAAEQELAYGQMVNVWAGMDPHAASAWVEALPAGPIKAASASRLGRSIQFFDPAGALAWALVGATAPRGEVNLRWLATWAGRNNPDECLRLIGGSGLSAELKQSLVQLAIGDWNTTQARLGHWDAMRSVSVHGS